VVEPAAPRRNVTPGPVQLPYIGGLDGLRALAVAAVLLYHAGLPVWGGFLGVESFFALSGYLITSLLVAEWLATGRISLATFWMRRARRLLPALFLVLVAVLAYTAIFLPEEARGLRDDALAATFYIMNWHLIWSGQSYFDPLTRPSLLQHVWSLAIEEQFYLLWPLLFMAGARWLRATGLLILTLLGVVASTLLMAYLADPLGDPSRVYYGTDTRAGGLLLGAALALCWAPGRGLATQSRSMGRALDIAGGLALVGLLTSFAVLDEMSAWLYRGGFALVSLLTVVLVAAVTHPQARVLPRLLGLAPLRWVGLRSYGIYLWHWPVFMVTRPYLDVPFDGVGLQLLRFGVVLLLAELSYRLIEMPIRNGGLTRLGQTVRTGHRAAVQARVQLERVAQQPWSMQRAPLLVKQPVERAARRDT
jgi:peptidoglycan/LPS O-acetylase OafA/YrhL